MRDINILKRPGKRKFNIVLSKVCQALAEYPIYKEKRTYDFKDIFPV